MHNAISANAIHIASAEPQLDKAKVLAPGVKMYAYPPVAFVENANGEAKSVRHAGHTFAVSARASALVNLETGKVLFDSGTVSAAATAAPREEPPRHELATVARAGRGSVHGCPCGLIRCGSCRFDGASCVHRLNHTDGLLQAVTSSLCRASAAGPSGPSRSRARPSNPACSRRHPCSPARPRSK